MRNLGAEQKQKLILFSALLIISLLAGTAGAIGEAENTDTVSTGMTEPSVSIAYNETGPFRMGDVVKITATFSEPVYDAVAIVGYSVLTPDYFNMTNLSNTVWSYDYEVPAGINDAVNVTVYGIGGTVDLIEKTDIHAFVVDNEAPRFDRIQPSSTYVNTECVVFEFSAFDKLDNTVAYALFINGTEKKSGIINSNGSVKYGLKNPTTITSGKSYSRTMPEISVAVDSRTCMWTPGSERNSCFSRRWIR